MDNNVTWSCWVLSSVKFDGFFQKLILLGFENLLITLTCCVKYCTRYVRCSYPCNRFKTSSCARKVVSITEFSHDLNPHVLKIHIQMTLGGTSDRLQMHISSKRIVYFRSQNVRWNSMCKFISDDSDWRLGKLLTFVMKRFNCTGKQLKYVSITRQLARNCNRF